jgi:hypothetical protein
MYNRGLPLVSRYCLSKTAVVLFKTSEGDGLYIGRAIPGSQVKEFIIACELLCIACLVVVFVAG